MGTVSNVLNSRSGVAPETSRKVLRAIESLGYKAKAVPRRYPDAGIRTGAIGLLCVGVPMETMRLPFFVKLVSNLEQALGHRNLHMVLVQAVDREVLPERVCPGRMDGAFLLGHPADRMIPALQRLHTVGVFGRPRPGIDWVSTDATEHGRLAGEYLLGRGHRRVAFLNPQRSHSVFAEFGRSFQQTMGSHGVEASMLVPHKDGDEGLFWTYQRYRKMAEELLQGFFALPADERPTGLYVANDEITQVTYELLAEHGVRLGVDIEIISNDNAEPFLSVLKPRPATIEPDYEEVARRAVDKVLYRIQHPNGRAGVKLLVPPHLIGPDGHKAGETGCAGQSMASVASHGFSGSEAVAGRYGV